MNSKGQESGPFELLVAVIMMGFVLMVGLQAIESVRFNDCVQKNNKTLEDFKTTIELVSKSNEQKKFFLDLPACASKKEQKLAFSTEQDPIKCSKYCSTARPSCVLLTLYNPKFSMIKCINIQFYTNFSTDSGSCGSIENYTLVDLFSGIGIEEARWQFRNITSSSASGTPIICAFKECKTGEC